MRLAALSAPPLAGKVAHDPVETAAAYDFAGPAYLAFADGDFESLFAFEGCHGYAGRLVWKQIDTALKDLLGRGERSIRILDAGCGPGTWLMRTETRAHALGFDRIEPTGFDICFEMIRLADENAALLGRYQFRTGDLITPQPEETGTIDLMLCLYALLNHLRCDFHKQVASSWCGSRQANSSPRSVPAIACQRSSLGRSSRRFATWSSAALPARSSSIERPILCFTPPARDSLSPVSANGTDLRL